MAKAAEAFRTISEVASDLDVPKHVLRFWEAKFPQIRPMKRGGGRRYYRPEDLELLKGIRRLLHAEGYTIKGVQKILREQGVDQVKAFAHITTTEKTKPRRGKADGAAAAALAGSNHSAPAKSANSKPARTRETPAQIGVVLQKAIAELQACRRLLLGEAEQQTEPARAARG
ncbi:MAG: MerR family transcriptional regulator [Hyphomicrobium sp.]|jgi:DNA-binding transcriptional MerR regulator|nr:MerR family transcriptional regulator [Hyphomicrobium sp.]